MRNINRNGGSKYVNRVIYEINKTLHFLTKAIYCWLPNIPYLWPDMIKFFEDYKPVIVTRRVTWQLPYDGWYKCNTGASRCNPGPSPLGFCVR